MTIDELQILLGKKENEHLEFKAARENYDFDELVKYCFALANERGGRLILGVGDKMPRAVVGSRAFRNIEETKNRLLGIMGMRVDVEEVQHTDGRVLVFDIPSRPTGVPLEHHGQYWMRSGEAVVGMTQDKLRRIFDETMTDFSSGICAAARLDDLDPNALNVLRDLWYQRSKNQHIKSCTDEQLLKDAELLIAGQVTYAALIMLGTHRALGKFLGQAEIVFEYRPDDVPGPAAERHEFRQGFLPVLDEIWRLIDKRNDLQHFQHALCYQEVPIYNEYVIREAVLNAVCHRSYQEGGSVFVRQFPQRIEIDSPGGFPDGITPENILYKQIRRNHRIADVLSKCGLVEKAGQGYDKIYSECIKQSKSLPDFSKTDDASVFLTLHGKIQDIEFLRFLRRLGGIGWKHLGLTLCW